MVSYCKLLQYKCVLYVYVYKKKSDYKNNISFEIHDNYILM